jgi:hypothetical protein
VYSGNSQPEQKFEEDKPTSSFLIVVTLIEDPPKQKRRKSEIPAQRHEIKNSTPPNTLLCRLRTNMSFNAFRRTIGARYCIRGAKLEQLNAILKWPGPCTMNGDWSIPIVPENVGDVLEWLCMRGGYAYVVVTLRGAESKSKKNVKERVHYTASSGCEP